MAFTPKYLGTSSSLDVHLPLGFNLILMMLQTHLYTVCKGKQPKVSNAIYTLSTNQATCFFFKQKDRLDLQVSFKYNGETYGEIQVHWNHHERVINHLSWSLITISMTINIWIMLYCFENGLSCSLSWPSSNEEFIYPLVNYHRCGKNTICRSFFEWLSPWVFHICTPIVILIGNSSCFSSIVIYFYGPWLP